MSELSSENWMAIIGIFSFFTWGVATFLFRRISVDHIEHEMAKEGIESPVWDKGIGARMIAYASIIAFPNLNRHASPNTIKNNIDVTIRNTANFLSFFRLRRLVASISTREAYV